MRTTKRTPRPYYTLLSRDSGHPVTNQWTIEFGDYDRPTVESELEDYLDHDWKAKDLKIITTTGQQADIEAMVRELNERLRG